MFNTYTFPTRTERVTEHVHEHRAPTDQSVSLLKELEREAADKVLSVNRLQNNIVDAQWVIVDDKMCLELTAVCRMKVNGHDLQFSVELDRPWRRESARKIVEAIAEKLAKYLVGEMLKNREMQTLLTR